MSDIKPLIEELRTGFSSIELFERISKMANSFFLDSAMAPEKTGRFSFMSYDPFLVFSSRGELVKIKENGRTIFFKGNPFDVLAGYLERYKVDSPVLGLPCLGGAIGYLSYDLGRFIENLPANASDDLALPESCLGFYDVIIIADNLTGRTYLLSTGFPETENIQRQIRAKERIQEFKEQISAGSGTTRKEPQSPEGCIKSGVLKSNFTRSEYIRAVEKARRYIIEGEIYEVNLSQRFEAPFAGDPFNLYRSLREINPAPFASYLNFEEVRVVGSSPERFLQLQGNRIETRPIKGTIRRGKNAGDDEANSKWLVNSEKNQAENMMIADLERNDLGRVCRTGTVKVIEFAALEKFPTVFHLTTTIEGYLKEGVARIDLLKASFPGGSITGAPKIRAMEIIEELEPTRRSIYTGSIGYFGFDGSMDLNIVIRSFLVKNKKVYFQVGGAVVFDSDPEEEYSETLNKGRALFRALNETGFSYSEEKDD
jgi:para-aminobenzoate synthetase component I